MIFDPQRRRETAPLFWRSEVKNYIREIIYHFSKQVSGRYYTESIKYFKTLTRDLDISSWIFSSSKNIYIIFLLDTVVYTGTIALKTSKRRLNVYLSA